MGDKWVALIVMWFKTQYFFGIWKNNLEISSIYTFRNWWVAFITFVQAIRWYKCSKNNSNEWINNIRQTATTICGKYHQYHGNAEVQSLFDSIAQARLQLFAWKIVFREFVVNKLGRGNWSNTAPKSTFVVPSRRISSCRS